MACCAEFKSLRGEDIYIGSCSLLNNNNDLTLSKRAHSNISIFEKVKSSVHHSTLSLLSNMHAFTKLMPLALASLAVALPEQLQKRASTAFDDNVHTYAGTDCPTLS